MAKVRSNKEVAEEAIKIFLDKKDQITYLHGSTGLKVNSNEVIVDNPYYKGKTQGSQVKAYFDYFKSQGKHNLDWNTWNTQHNGKQTFDCSNSVLNYLIYGWKDDGTHEIGCNSCWSSSAPQKWEQVAEKDVMPGMVAWKSGHVGLVVQTKPDIITIDIPTYNQTFRKLNCSKENKGYWTGYAKFPSNFVKYDYVEPDVPTPSTPVPVSITAKMNGKDYKAGQNLSAKDFTVEVKFSDGTTRVNLPNWYATPLTLKEGANTITVGYQNVKTTIQVNTTSDFVKIAVSTDYLKKAGMVEGKDYKLIQ